MIGKDRNRETFGNLRHGAGRAWNSPRTVFDRRCGEGPWHIGRQNLKMPSGIVVGRIRGVCRCTAPNHRARAKQGQSLHIVLRPAIKGLSTTNLPSRRILKQTREANMRSLLPVFVMLGGLLAAPAFADDAAPPKHKETQSDSFIMI